MNDPQENEIHIQVTKNSPGKRLRKAREDKGLSRKDIAERLHLSEQVIDSIERDDQNHLPAHTFVRGYLRGYAPLVSLDADSVIADYNNYFADRVSSSEIKDALRFGAERKRTGKSKTGKIKAYLAIVLCVVVGIGYFAGQESTDGVSGVQEPAINNGNSVADTGADFTDVNSLQPGDSGSPYQMLDNAAGSSIQKQQPSKDVEQVIVSASDDSMNANPGKNQGEHVEKEKKSPKLSSWDYFDVLEDDGAGVSLSQEPGSEKSSMPIEVSSLSLQFHADAWTEVYDSRGERLLYRLGREGRTYQVSGAAPFKVLLGNAKEVTVMLNGQLFDQTPFIRGQVARFSTGKKPAGEESAGEKSASEE